MQEREVLAGAPPEKIIGLVGEWVGSQYKSANSWHSSRFRYHLVVDKEVVRHLLQLPMPAEHCWSEDATYAIKVCDLQGGLSVNLCGEDDYDSDGDDEDTVEEKDDGYRSWFWIGADWLVGLWINDEHAAVEGPVSLGWTLWSREAGCASLDTRLILACGHSEALHRAMYPSLFRQEDDRSKDVELILD